MTYCRLVLKVLLREPVLWAATASFALLLSLSALVPYPLYGPGLLRQVLRMNHESLSTNLASGAFDGAPNRLIDDINQQLAYMEDALSADTSSGFYATLAELYRANEEEVSSGTLVGSSALEAEVNVRYAEAMSEAGETPEYDSSTQLPALLLASVVPSTLPQFVLVILPLLIGLSVSMVTDWRKLLGSSTVSRSIAVLSRCIVGVIVCLVTFALSCLPFLAISTLKNGLGSPTYPIVFLRGGRSYRRLQVRLPCGRRCSCSSPGCFSHLCASACHVLREVQLLDFAVPSCSHLSRALPLTTCLTHSWAFPWRICRSHTSVHG